MNIKTDLFVHASIHILVSAKLSNQPYSTGDDTMTGTRLKIGKQ